MEEYQLGGQGFNFKAAIARSRTEDMFIVGLKS
jgi:hypothetical protein